MKTYHVTVEKRDGKTVTGTMHDDGLQDLWPVLTADGVEYVSSLDRFIKKVRVVVGGSA